MSCESICILVTRLKTNLTAPKVCRSSSFPTAQSFGTTYVFQANPTNEAIQKKSASQLVSKLINRKGKGRHTIRHAQTKIIQTLPIRERVLNRALSAIIRRIVVILEEVSDNKLALALRAQQEPESEAVEETPRTRVREVQQNDALRRHRRQQG